MSVFKRGRAGLNSEISPRLVAIPRLKHSLPNYLPIAGGRIVGFMPFKR